MEIQGKIIGALPETSGTSKAGKPWRKCTYVLETQEQYPKKLAFDLLGDRIDRFAPKVGEYVKVSFDLNSREFNGKWFTNATAWNVERPQYQPQSAFSQQPQQPVQQQPTAQPPNSSTLPF